MKQFKVLMQAALHRVIGNASAEEFLAWAKSATPIVAPLILQDYNDKDRSKMAYWMGVHLWNAAPLPSNHFKPQPLEKPNRNSICPCGSGFKYKQCCSRLPPLEPFPTEVYWSILHEVITKKQINLYINDQQLPVNAVAIIAEQFFNLGDNAQVIKMLDPLFAGKAERLNYKHSYLLDTLCDSYNAHYKTDRKKKDLLQRMSQHKDRSVQAEAWQRISGMEYDSGDFTAAMSALTKAMQADPENPNHSVLELSLLVSSNKIEQAKQRAMFWLRKLSHLEHNYPDLIHTLKLAQTDPAAALQYTTNINDDDPRLMRLLQWIDENQNIPRVDYLLNEYAGEEENNEAQPNSTPLLNTATLYPPSDIENIEEQWEQITPIDKPFSTQFAPEGDMSLWDDPSNTQWLEFLTQNPQAINSLDIMDDLITLIYLHPSSITAWGPMSNIQSLFERNEGLLQKINKPGQRCLAWGISENRPALRILAHHINLNIEKDQIYRAMELALLYLQLNANDNHGYRSLLINHYLQQDENQQAIELAAKYPHDQQAEIIYGSVLAHYRLDNIDLAEQALKVAIDELPLVASYLIKARVAQPEFNDFGITYGGEDQAWFYRDEMRETWQQTKGCLAWLKKQMG